MAARSKTNGFEYTFGFVSDFLFKEWDKMPERGRAMQNSSPQDLNTKILGSDQGMQDSRQRLQDGVSDDMPVYVIYSLKAIYVERKHRQRERISIPDDYFDEEPILSAASAASAARAPARMPCIP